MLCYCLQFYLSTHWVEFLPLQLPPVQQHGVYDVGCSWRLSGGGVDEDSILQNRWQTLDSTQSNILTPCHLFHKLRKADLVYNFDSLTLFTKAFLIHIESQKYYNKANLTIWPKCCMVQDYDNYFIKKKVVILTSISLSYNKRLSLNSEQNNQTLSAWSSLNFFLKSCCCFSNSLKTKVSYKNNYYHIM